MQYLLGIFMFSLSFQVDGLLEQGNITKITAGTGLLSLCNDWMNNYN